MTTINSFFEDRNELATTFYNSFKNFFAVILAEHQLEDYYDDDFEEKENQLTNELFQHFNFENGKDLQ
eukprot:Pgem_evm1s2914